LYLLQLLNLNVESHAAYSYFVCLFQRTFFIRKTVTFTAGTYDFVEESVIARVEAIGLVDSYIASNPTESGAEVLKWWRQHKKDKKSFDYRLRMMITQLDELGKTNPAFDVSEDHSLSQIIHETRTNYKENNGSPFTADHFVILSGIGFTFVDNTKTKKARQSSAKEPKSKRAKKSITARYASLLNDTLPPLSPVNDMAAVCQLLSPVYDMAAVCAVPIRPYVDQ